MCNDHVSSLHPFAATACTRCNMSLKSGGGGGGGGGGEGEGVVLKPPTPPPPLPIPLAYTLLFSGCKVVELGMIITDQVL